MFRYLISAVMTLILAASSFAQTDIKTEHRVANVGNGFCGWCAVETLGRHQGIKSLQGLVARKHKALGDNGGGAWNSTLASELCSLGINHYYTHVGAYYRSMMQDAIAKNGGVVVGLRPVPPDKNGHYVVCVGYTDKHAYVIDSNDPKKTTKMSRAKFDNAWDGSMLVFGR